MGGDVNEQRERRYQGSWQVWSANDVGSEFAIIHLMGVYIESTHVAL